MNFNKEQEAAIFSKQPLVVISAGAGSGKTRVLTERYVHICEEKLKERLNEGASSPIAATVEEIVAITFTEKAAREMKDRIRGKIESMHREVKNKYSSRTEQEQASEFWQQQKEALDTALITTFHSFCHKLLHEYAFEADVTPNFLVLDDVQAKLIQIDIFEEMFDSPELHQLWRPLYQYYTRNQLKESLKAVYSQMKEIITSVESIEQFFDRDTIIQMQLEAIENDRKKELSEFYKEARPYVMELNETDKAQKKIIDHFAEIHDQSFENPNSLYEALEEAMPKRVSNSWQENVPPLFDLYEQLYKPLKALWKKLKGPSEEDIEELKNIIGLFAHMLSVFHEKYDEAKRERAAMDFSDLQQKAIALLEKKEVQEKCRSKYRHMMVDEFQDTNQLQMNMLKFIQPAYQFIVGDGKQSIYRFRGADVSLMKELIDLSKESKTSDFINMSTNYRTCDSIIQFVNLAFQTIMGDQEGANDPSYKIIYSFINSARNDDEERKRRVELITVPGDDQDKVEEDEEINDLPSEYEVIVNRMIELMKEGKNIVSEKEIWRKPEWKDFAILIQTRSKLTKLERALKDKQVPYVVYGGIGFYEKQEVRDMLSLLQWLNRPWEPLYILSLLRNPVFGMTVEGFLTINECLEEEVSLGAYVYEGIFLDDPSIEDTLKNSLLKLKQFYERWVPFHPQTSIKEFLEELFTQSGMKTLLLLQRNNLQQVKNVEKLIDVLAQFQNASLDELLQKVKQLAALSDKEGEAEVELAEGNMVHIMTVHASKGLEFPIVFLPDLAKSIRPDSGSIRFDKDVRVVVQYEKEKENEPLKSPDKKSSPSFELIKERARDQAIEEAKRLFYVAVTRARDYLVLSTNEKSSKHSWYDMLLSARETNSRLDDLIKDITFVEGQEEWVEEGERYTPPEIVTLSDELSTFSVSEVMAFISNPLDYYYKYIIKAEMEWLTSDQEVVFVERDPQGISGATLGTIVHRAYELLDQGFTEEEAKEEALALFEDDRNRYQEALDDLLTNYHFLNEMELGNQFANEWAFSVEIEGATIIGEIDKIVEKNGSYHLIDIKTNFHLQYEKLIRYYAPQLYLYKVAFEESTGHKVDAISLFFVRGGEEGFRTLSFDPELEIKIRKAIKDMAELKAISASKEQYLSYRLDY